MPSQGKDVGQDPLGDHPAAAPDNARPSSQLTKSDKESGKAVYGSDKKKVGSIDHVMIDKRSNEIAYAVLNLGGFLGFGTDQFPVPWKVLRYDSNIVGKLSVSEAGFSLRRSRSVRHRNRSLGR